MTCTGTVFDKEGLPEELIEVSDRGSSGLAVFIQDQTTNTLNVPFLIERNASALLNNAVVNDRTVTLEPGHLAVVGNILEIADPASIEFMQSKVLIVAGDVITLDQPVNFPYIAATALVIVSDESMLVNGSVTPQVFSILPLPAQKGDMVRIIWHLNSTSDMDFITFGGASALTNGCVLRVNHGDGTYRNIINFKSNGDIIEQCFDHTFLLPKGGNTTKGFTARLTWGGQSKHGVVIRLDGSKGESLEVVIQDDLTSGNTKFHILAQGHELQE
jgi:hypothetical protein